MDRYEFVAYGQWISRNGKFQMLSETLFIAFRNFLHPQRSDCPLLVEPSGSYLIIRFSVRQNRGQIDLRKVRLSRAGQIICCVTTHQFRQWLNYIVDKGGLPIDLQTRWLGRENHRDTEAYRHATVDERLTWVKDGIRSGQLSGT